MEADMKTKKITCDAHGYKRCKKCKLRKNCPSLSGEHLFKLDTVGGAFVIKEKIK